MPAQPRISLTRDQPDESRWEHAPGAVGGESFLSAGPAEFVAAADQQADGEAEIRSPP
jgi:hypothetical protein